LINKSRKDSISGQDVTIHAKIAKGEAEYVIAALQKN
jgi:hypothetical protein